MGRIQVSAFVLLAVLGSIVACSSDEGSSSGAAQAGGASGSEPGGTGGTATGGTGGSAIGGTGGVVTGGTGGAPTGGTGGVATGGTGGVVTGGTGGAPTGGTGGVATGGTGGAAVVSIDCTPSLGGPALTCTGGDLCCAVVGGGTSCAAQCTAGVPVACDGPEDCGGHPCCYAGYQIGTYCATGTECNAGDDPTCQEFSECPTGQYFCCIDVPAGSIRLLACASMGSCM
jgi:hypothetical protein